MSALRPLVIIGAGGHGREVLDVVRAINDARAAYEFLGFLDDGRPDESLLSRVGARWLGSRQKLADIDAAYLIAIGHGSSRRGIDLDVSSLGREPATAVHPGASIGADVELGPGSVVTAGVRLTTHIRMGRHVHLNVNASVSHDCALGDYVTVNPGATISGNVELGDEVTIGAGAVVIQGVSVGKGAVVGAGAAVVHDVEPGATVVGVPARPLER